MKPVRTLNCRTAAETIRAVRTFPIPRRYRSFRGLVAKLGVGLASRAVPYAAPKGGTPRNLCAGQAEADPAYLVRARDDNRSWLVSRQRRQGAGRNDFKRGGIGVILIR